MMAVFIFRRRRANSMLHLHTLITFFGISLLLGLTPGPDNIFVLMHSAMNGRKAGLMVVLGLCTGLVGHTLAVALGLAAVFAASATAFTALKIVGALYMAYLACQALRAPAGTVTSGAQASAGAQQSHVRSYIRGVLMNLTNPKVVIFFLALLPQFTDAKRGNVVPQLLSLGAIFIAATLASFGFMVYCAGSFGALLQRSARMQLLMNRLAGLVFLGLASRLVLAQR